ncbi:MAG: TPR-repeat-containing protein [candidate division NC10 bacterium CSP1-5]|nr:MAG: TPR-repeat-containing protein [candidate division NC10 bacterium CSP1-5]
MKIFKQFFRRNFRYLWWDRPPELGNNRTEVRTPGKDSAAQSLPSVVYKKGEIIGRDYRVYGVLGIGGFGLVYLVYSHTSGTVFALKTVRDDFLDDAETRERFRREAQVWVDLGRHPYLVRAYYVDDIRGRLFIAMEYIAPNEQGLNSLEGYLTSRPPDLAQSLRWSVQFCHGMEYAYTRGILCHRDIKPSNILISKDRMVKISDFGLAGALATSKSRPGITLSIRDDRVGLSCQTLRGTGFGTPGYMPAEQFKSAAECDERSDIYAFGVVLYQMASGGKLPFLAVLPRDNSEAEAVRFWIEMYKRHSEYPIPRLNSPLFRMIERCLQKDPRRRYQTFADLSSDLEMLLMNYTGEVIRPPELKALEAWEWSNKGLSLYALGQHSEAIQCLDQALALDPLDAGAWNDKGRSLSALGRFEEALGCYDRAVELDQGYSYPWVNKALALQALRRYEEALRCYDDALKLDPRAAWTWNNKGLCLHGLGRFSESLSCYDEALKLDPRNSYAWNNKGLSLQGLGRLEEALSCFDRALELDPGYSAAWQNKGLSLRHAGRVTDALYYFDKALEFDPRDAKLWSNKASALLALGRYEEALGCCDIALELKAEYAHAWNNKGICLKGLGRGEEALRCYDRALQHDPLHLNAWHNKGNILHELGHFEEAVDCYRHLLQLDPRNSWTWLNKGRSLHSLGRLREALHCYDESLKLHPYDPLAWYNKGLAEDKLGQRHDAVYSFQQVVKLAPPDYRDEIQYSRRRLQELEGG